MAIPFRDGQSAVTPQADRNATAMKVTAWIKFVAERYGRTNIMSITLLNFESCPAVSQPKDQMTAEFNVLGAGSGVAAGRDELNNRLFFRLFQAANTYETHAVRELDVSAVQGAVLGALSRHIKTGMSFSSLYAYLEVSRQNLDAVLKRLETLDYVERIEDRADRRARIVRLTSTGRRAWLDLQKRTITFFRDGTQGVSTKDIAQCIETLVRVRRALKGLKQD
jgi:DNA-binding MarR family transcriptional regulator